MCQSSWSKEFNSCCFMLTFHNAYCASSISPSCGPSQFCENFVFLRCSCCGHNFPVQTSEKPFKLVVKAITSCSCLSLDKRCTNDINIKKRVPVGDSDFFFVPSSRHAEYPIFSYFFSELKIHHLSLFIDINIVLKHLRNLHTSCDQCT